MAKTNLGEFIVEEAIGKFREKDRVRISVLYNGVDGEQRGEIKSRLIDFIKDIGKYEMFVKGFSSLIDMGLPLEKRTSNITNLDFDFERTKEFEDKDIVTMDKTEFYLYLYAKTDKITKQGKELSPDNINIMIENIERYRSIKEMLKLAKMEILDWDAEATLK